MADARDLKSLGEDPYRFESGHKHQRFKLGLKQSENGSLAQVPLLFFGSPYAIAFRSVYVTGERNSDAIAPRYSRISPSPIGNRYSGRSRGLSQMRQVVPYRRSLFRRSAMNCLSPYAHFAPYGCRLRQLSRSCCQCSLDNSILQRSPGHKQCKSLQVAIGCFREKVYYTLSESRALSSPIGASSRPRPSPIEKSYLQIARDIV